MGKRIAQKSSQLLIYGYSIENLLAFHYYVIIKASASQTNSLATLSNCGEILKSLVLRINSNINLDQNKELMYSKNLMNKWMSAQPSSDLQNAVQRLNVNGFEKSSLRYSLVPLKYVERQGINGSCLFQLNALLLCCLYANHTFHVTLLIR